ncbi:MAG: hypothetical protein ACYDIE_12015 [Candidatus Krumholzibacteriia bacterium]
MPLVRLACDHCGGDLPAPPDAVLFACPACGRAGALAGGRLVAVPTLCVPPRQPAPAGVSGHYPCWVTPVVWAESATPPTPSAGPAPWRLPGRIVVPSLAPETGGAWLRLARAMSLAADGWTAAPGALRGAAGGQLGEAEAARLLVTVALACVPAALRLKLLEADTPPLRAGPPTLAWLPFALAGGRLLDLVAGIEVTDRLLGAAPPAPSGPHAKAPLPAAGTGALNGPREPEPIGAGRAR